MSRPNAHLTPPGSVSYHPHGEILRPPSARTEGHSHPCNKLHYFWCARPCTFASILFHFTVVSQTLCQTSEHINKRQKIRFNRNFIFACMWNPTKHLHVKEFPPSTIGDRTKRVRVQVLKRRRVRVKILKLHLSIRDVYAIYICNCIKGSLFPLCRVLFFLRKCL